MTGIADAIREKTGDTAEIPFADWAGKIRGIQTKQDLSFVTAGAEQILSGYVGADKGGNPIAGTLVPKQVYIANPSSVTVKYSRFRGIFTFPMPDFNPDFIAFYGSYTCSSGGNTRSECGFGYVDYINQASSLHFGSYNSYNDTSPSTTHYGISGQAGYAFSQCPYISSQNRDYITFTVTSLNYSSGSITSSNGKIIAVKF